MNDFFNIPKTYKLPPKQFKNIKITYKGVLYKKVGNILQFKLKILRMTFSIIPITQKLPKNPPKLQNKKIQKVM